MRWRANRKLCGEKCCCYSFSNMMFCLNINEMRSSPRSDSHVNTDSFGKREAERRDYIKLRWEVRKAAYLQFLELLVDRGEVLSLVHVGQLTLQLAQPLVQAFVTLHQQVGLVGFEKLAGFCLSGALQILPALPDLLQLLPHHRTELRLLLDQLLALLDGPETGGRQEEDRRKTEGELRPLMS